MPSLTLLGWSVLAMMLSPVTAAICPGPGIGEYLEMGPWLLKVDRCLRLNISGRDHSSDG
ncbi:hypothetical protein LZ32DRAFT_598718 [Colletotrichum eremochloae]|nr:hypothetical protein LZ32DRAFT_598718 [Colletotrichum eremochloae]